MGWVICGVPPTTGIEHLWPRILPSDHLVASSVAYDHENRRMIFCISPLERSDDDFLGTTFSSCPTFRQLAVYLNAQTIANRLTAITSPI
jgi:hypothetical protein